MEDCGRSRGGRSYNNRPQCHICGKIGHTVIKCYYKFDHSYQGNETNNAASFSSSQNNSQTQNNVNLAHTQEELPIEQAPFEAMVAPTQGTNDKGWYLDSGATNHVTNDFNNISCGTDYHGNQKIHMGNGKSLYIKHIGNFFHFPIS